MSASEVIRELLKNPGVVVVLAVIVLVLPNISNAIMWGLQMQADMAVNRPVLAEFVAIHKELAARAEMQADIAQACLEALAEHD